MSHLVATKSNTLLETSMIKILASCSLNFIYGKHITPSLSFSLMKCHSISIGIILSCWIKLWAILGAVSLSQYSVRGYSSNSFKSLIRILSHKSSHTSCAKHLNSTLAGFTLIQHFVFYFAISPCFLLEKYNNQKVS